MWGQTTSGAGSRKSGGPDQNRFSSNTTPRHYSTPHTADASLNEKNNYSTTESMTNDDEEDVVYDPEAATAGPTQRPSMCFKVQLTV
jgi:hypothetical protein